MLGHSGLGQGQFVDDVTAHPRFFLGEHSQNAHAHRMGNRLGKGRELLIGAGTVDRGGLELDGPRVLRGAAGALIGW